LLSKSTLTLAGHPYTGGTDAADQSSKMTFENFYEDELHDEAQKTNNSIYLLTNYVY